MNKLEYFIYNHNERAWAPAPESDRKKLDEVTANDPAEIGKALDAQSIDALLLLDEKGGRWYLAYGNSLGIIGQRTSRRQADTIARSGYRMPQGYTIKGNYPLDEITEVDLGDLWKTVQQKYVKSTLGGMEIDKATGLPSQLAERAERLSGAGHSDDLTSAKYEKEEAEARQRAIDRSEGTSTPKPKLKETKKAAKKTPKAVEETPKPKTVPKKKKSKKKAIKKSKVVISGEGFFEISSVKENVVDGFSQSIAQGKITYGTEEALDAIIVFDQKHLSQAEWTKIGVFLKSKDIVQVTIETDDGIDYATSLKI